MFEINSIDLNGDETTTTSFYQMSINDLDVEKTLLTKSEREELFLKAEKLYKEGEINTAVAIYLQCLQNLEIKTAFSSLPKCLRALANHFLDEKDYEKSVHFIQAERLYYESALLDTAAFQKKINEITGETYVDLLPADDLINSEHSESKADRIIEYEYIIKYFDGTDQPDLALVYAEKLLKMKQCILGPHHPLTIQTVNEIELFKTNYLMENQKLSKQPINNSYKMDNLEKPKEKLNFIKSTKIDRIQTRELKYNQNAVGSEVTQSLSMKNDIYADIERIFRISMLAFIVLLLLVFVIVYSYSIYLSLTSKHTESIHVLQIPDKESLDIKDVFVENNSFDVVINPIKKTYREIRQIVGQWLRKS